MFFETSVITQRQGVTSKKTRMLCNAAMRNSSRASVLISIHIEPFLLWQFVRLDSRVWWARLGPGKSSKRGFLACLCGCGMWSYVPLRVAWWWWCSPLWIWPRIITSNVNCVVSAVVKSNLPLVQGSSSTFLNYLYKMKTPPPHVDDKNTRKGTDWRLCYQVCCDHTSFVCSWRWMSVCLGFFPSLHTHPPRLLEPGEVQCSFYFAVFK